MKLLTLGINHKTAPIELREQVSIAPDVCVKMLHALKLSAQCHEAVIVSTCNRTEIYLAGLQLDMAVIVHIWADFCQLSYTEIKEHLYIYHQDQSVRHLFRVACGLDSLVLGEPQILGQLKDAYACSQESAMLGKYLNYQFQSAFQVAKKVRTETQIGAFTVSVAYTAVQLAKQIFESLSEESVLLVGAGETIELVAKHLIEAGVKNLTIANRTLSRANDLIQRLQNENAPLQLKSIDLFQLNDYLYQADMLIASTGADLPIIFQDAIKLALKKRKYKPMFMVDLAVPRDISVEVSQLDDVYLYTVDDLQNIIEDNQNARQSAALLAEDYISDAVIKWSDWEKIASHSQLIQVLIDNTEMVRQSALELAQKQIAQGVSVEKAMLQMSKQLCNKLNHAPLTALKTAINTQDIDKLEFIKEYWIRP